MTKREIENCGIAGTRLDGSDVASLSRDMRVMTLRHRWPEGTDGRVLSVVRSAFMRGAKEIAKTTGKSVEVYAKEGFMLEQVDPS